jgi:hypothetical protein
MVLESLMECYARIEDEEEQEDSPRIKSASDKIRSELYEWRRKNVKRINLMYLIHQEPTRSLQQFVQDLTKFQETADRIHALLHTQRNAKNRDLSNQIHQET